MKSKEIILKAKKKTNRKSKEKSKTKKKPTFIRKIFKILSVRLKDESI